MKGANSGLQPSVWGVSGAHLPALVVIYTIEYLWPEPYQFISSCLGPGQSGKMAGELVSNDRHFAISNFAWLPGPVFLWLFSISLIAPIFPPCGSPLSDHYMSSSQPWLHIRIAWGFSFKTESGVHSILIKWESLGVGLSIVIALV